MTIPTHYFYLEEPVTNHASHIEAMYEDQENRAQNELQWLQAGCKI